MEPIEPRTGMHHIDIDECLRLLAGHAHGVGRLAVVEGGAPTILPVNYAMADDRVVLRTAPGSKLESAFRRGRVAFEIDHIDSGHGGGWSVVVRGRAEVVTKERAAVLMAATGLQPWVDGKPYWVVIHPESITGRRVPLGLFAL